MKDLRIRLAGGDEVSAGFASMMKDKDWSGQKVAMFILKQYFTKPVAVIAMPGTGLAVVAAKKKAPAKRFVKPTWEEAAGYFLEVGSDTCQDEAHAFIDHFTTNGWKVGKAKNPMKDWKAAIRTWNRNNKGNTHGKDQSKAISGRDAITFQTTDF